MKMFKKFCVAASLLLVSPAFAQDADIDADAGLDTQVETTPHEDMRGGEMSEDEMSIEGMEDDTYSGEVEDDAIDRGGIDREPASTQRTEAEAEDMQQEPQIGVTNFALRPSAGAVFFNEQERFAGGVLMDFNVVSLDWMKLGPATGAIFSSNTTGDFFNGVSTSNNNYFFQIPANLKATFAPDPSRRLQIGVHGGANVIRSTGTAGTFGSDDVVAVTDTGASWDVHPNVGGDIDFALGTNVDLTLRPDVTFLDDFNMVTTTLGLALKL